MILKDRVAVITGAAGGLGSAMARRFVAEGALVCATDIRLKELQALVADVGGPPAVVGVEMDVTSEQDCERLAAGLTRCHGVVDVLVNCAGRFPVTRFEDITYAEWRDVCAIDLDGTFLMTKAVLPLLKMSKAGRIINVSSGSIFKGAPNQCHCVAAKAGVIGLTRSLAQALGKYDITVNAITPGMTATPPVAKLSASKKLDDVVNGRALKRRETAEDLVGTAVFLASGDSAFMTGQTLNVDGGTSFV